MESLDGVGTKVVPSPIECLAALSSTGIRGSIDGVLELENRRPCWGPQVVFLGDVKVILCEDFQVRLESERGFEPWRILPSTCAAPVDIPRVLPATIEVRRIQFKAICLSGTMTDKHQAPSRWPMGLYDPSVLVPIH